MRQAVYAALTTLLAAIGLTGGIIGMDETEALSPEVSGPDPSLQRPPVLPPVSLPVPGPPLAVVDDEPRPHPETFVLIVEQEPDPEPDEPVTQMTAESPAPGPSDTGMGSDVEQWRELATAHFGAGADVALCLMVHESGGNPNATNPSSGAAGLMQVLPSWADVFGVPVDALYDPDTNLRISAALYADGGWGHWAPWNRGECH